MMGRGAVLFLLVLQALGVLLGVGGHGGHEEEVEQNACGSYGFCITHPKDCSFSSEGPRCSIAVSWVIADDEDSLIFSMKGDTKTYLAFGMSTSGAMPDSEVYGCTVNSAIVRTWNKDYQNEPREKKGLSEEKISYEDGVLDCSFKRKHKDVGDSDPEYLDLRENNSYIFIMAFNGELTEKGNLGYHVNNKVKSGERIDLTAVTTEMRQVLVEEHNKFLPKLHGILMTIAWLGLVALGITTSRFYKPIWPDSQLCGTKVWFAIHRACMVTATCLFITAYIIIVVHVKGYITPGEGAVRCLHAAFGTVVVGLGIINVIMAVFRPHPGEPRRAIYNWAHWFVGSSALLLAFITILLGVSNFSEQSPLLGGIPDVITWVILVFLGFHVAMWTALQWISCTVENTGRENDLPLQNDDETEKVPINSDGSVITPTEDEVFLIRKGFRRKQQSTVEGARIKQLLYWAYATGVIVTVLIVVFGIIVAK